MASNALKATNWAARLLTLSRPAPRYSSSTTPLKATPPRRAARPYNSKLSELSSTISKPASTSATSSGATTPKPPTTSSGSASSSPSNTTAPPRAASPGDKVNNLSKSGLSDSPFDESREYVNPEHIDWTRSYHGLSAEPFSKEAAQVLLQETAPDDVEIKPDGIVYLPEIKYRRILNKAFGPGGWGLVPRGESIVTPKMVTREYALVAHGRLVSIARGEQDYFSPDGIPTATEGCKSNAMMRCCKDLGVASELWDPRWIRKYKANHAREVFVEHVVNKRKMKIWIRKDDAVGYPFKESKYN